MLRVRKLPDDSLFIELSRKGHVFRFSVVRHMKTEAMRHIGVMAAQGEAGFGWGDAAQVCTAIRAAFPEHMNFFDFLKAEAAKWKADW